MSMLLSPIKLEPCLKGYTRDLDKVVSPLETIERVTKRLQDRNLDILAETRRVDTGRLGIPVYMSICGKDAKAVLPTRKQMGKGSSPEQAQASAVMELVERFSYFSFLKESPHFISLSWQEAEERFGHELIPLTEITRSVGEELDQDSARAVLNTVRWSFHPATDLGKGRIKWLPLDWFKLLNEFNGTSAGNTESESLLQGLSELIERHVCCEIDARHLTTPTIRRDSCTDPVLEKLCQAFERENIHLVLKDFSLDMPLPTVAALAWDPATFPERSEIVFTAGTASSAAKAAIRAVTEVAQLAGDFCTKACYEASGLPKFHRLEEANWLLNGEEKDLADLPGLFSNDITEELLHTVRGLAPRSVYAVRTSSPLLEMPAHYTIVPGLSFRERDTHQSLGLFVGRKLVEEEELSTAAKGLQILEQIYGRAHFLPFFKGLLALRTQEHVQAREHFTEALPLQPDNDAKALTLFYRGYNASQTGDWKTAIPDLEAAHSLAPDMKEYANLLGVAYFKTRAFQEACTVFRHVLSVDKGSAMDLANLGVCEAALGQKEPAQEHLWQALQLDPTLDFAREHLEKL